MFKLQNMWKSEVDDLPGVLNAINGGSTRSTAVLGLELLLLGDGTIKPRSESFSTKYMPVSSAARSAHCESSNGSASTGSATTDEGDVPSSIYRTRSYTKLDHQKNPVSI
jgi:hypothetical protein